MNSQASPHDMPHDMPQEMPHETLATWRARGDNAIDPARFRFIEALARRALSHEGDARRVLDDRLAQLLAAYGKPATHAPPADAAVSAVAAVAAAAPSQRASALGALVASLARPEETRPAPEALAYLRTTWSRLSAERRLTESLSEMPENVGPLNSHHLAHRALVLMRDLSPQYLSRFLAHVDALLWLEQVQAGAAAPKAEGGRKSARGAALKAP